MIFFAILILFCGLFVFLLSLFPLWTSLIATYLSGMFVVACVAYVGRKKAQLYEVWEEVADVESAK